MALLQPGEPGHKRTTWRGQCTAGGPRDSRRRVSLEDPAPRGTGAASDLYLTFRLLNQYKMGRVV